MARKIPYITVVQIEGQAITVARFKMAAKNPVEASLRRITGPWQDLQAQEDALRRLADELHLREDRVALVLPRYDVTTRFLSLPSHLPEEVAGMVRFSAEEYVPYALDELIIDQCILKVQDSGESQALAALAHRDVVHKPLALLRQCGITPEKVLLSTACLAAAAAATPILSRDRHAVANLTAGGIEIIVMDGGLPVFSRGIITSQNWEATALDPDAGEGGGLIESSGAEELAGELRGSLAAFRRESPDGVGVDHIYLSCPYADVTRLCQSLSEKMGRDCKPADFALSLLQGAKTDMIGLPVEAVGALLDMTGAAKIAINLLPESESEARRIETIKKRILCGAAFAALILLALGGWYYQATAQRAALIRELEQRIARIEPNARGITEKREALNILSRQVDRKGSIIEQLAHLVEAAPADRLNFLRLTLRRGEGIELWGRAKEVNDVADFTQNIRNKAEGYLKFFAQARSLYEQQTMERDVSVFSYQIEALPPEEENAE